MRQRFRLLTWTVLALALPLAPLVAGARGLAKGKHSHGKTVSSPCTPKSFARAWDQFPATVELKGFKETVYALGDVHGAFDEAVELLRQAGLIKVTGTKPSLDFEWTAGKATLVQIGDLIDKGPRSFEVLRFFMALETKAAAAGGRVVVLAGNHEMAFLSDPFAKKTREFRADVVRSGKDVCTDAFAEDCPVGKWLRNRPAAALVNGIFFSHAGWTQEKSLADLGHAYETAVNAGHWDDEFTCGNHRVKPATAGFFNADDWWMSGTDIDRQLKAVGATQIVFGHDPHAFGSKGEMIGRFATPAGRAVVKIDVGLWQQSGPAALYKCSTWRDGDRGCAKAERVVLPLEHGAKATTEPLPLTPEEPRPEKSREIRLGC